MKTKDRILILGAGLVSRPGVTYLLEQGLKVTVADLFKERADEIVNGFSNGTGISLDVKDEAALRAQIEKNDIVVSLLPWTLHIHVAKLCLELEKDMATTSYVSPEMQALDGEVRGKGLLFLNEIGVDPGIDHMSAKKIIDEVQESGGTVEHFYSYCGGLPAPKHNDNPFGYKFSWSPRGVVLASRNSARFFENGETVDIIGEELFAAENVETETIDGIGKLEVYANRDSIPYIDIYGLKNCQTVKRGTYRFIGWCDTFKKIVELGLVDETAVDGISGIRFFDMMDRLSGSGGDPVSQVAEKIGLSTDTEVMKRLIWLGLFDKNEITEQNNYLDNLSDLLQRKLFYKEGETDMLVMKHRFEVCTSEGKRQQITSTLIDYGIPGGDSSMARTVSLPLAIGVTLMAEDAVPLTGVIRPVDKRLYLPVLKRLETLGIRMTEEYTDLN